MNLKLFVALVVVATVSGQYGPIKRPAGPKRTTTPFPPQEPDYDPDINSLGPDSYEENDGALAGGSSRPQSPAGVASRPDNPWLSSIVGQNPPGSPSPGSSPNYGNYGGSPQSQPPSVPCNNPGYVCAPKYQCQGGVTSSQGTGSNQCNPNSETCCRQQQPQPQQPQQPYRPPPPPQQQPQPQQPYRPPPPPQPQPQPQPQRPPFQQQSQPQPYQPQPQPYQPQPQPYQPQPQPQPFRPQPQPSFRPPQSQFQPQPSNQQQYQPGVPIGGSIYDSQPPPNPPRPIYPNNYVTEAPYQKYTGPLNTTPHPGCAAALKCVDESYCTWDGFMADSPQHLARDQVENKVPLSDCQDIETGIIGKCCRDPNYKDPWPAGMMMNSGPFDDGQYHPGQNQNGAPQPQPQPQPQPYYPQPAAPPPFAPQQPQQPQFSPNSPPFGGSQPSFNSRPSGTTPTPPSRSSCGYTANCTPANLCPADRQTQPGKECRVPNDDSTGVCCQKLQFPQNTNNQQYRPPPSGKPPSYSASQQNPQYSKTGPNSYSPPKPAPNPYNSPSSFNTPKPNPYNPYQPQSQPKPASQQQPTPNPYNPYQPQSQPKPAPQQQPTPNPYNPFNQPSPNNPPRANFPFNAPNSPSRPFPTPSPPKAVQQPQTTPYYPYNRPLPEQPQPQQPRPGYPQPQQPNNPQPSPNPFNRPQPQPQQPTNPQQTPSPFSRSQAKPQPQQRPRPGYPNPPQPENQSKPSPQQPQRPKPEYPQQQPTSPKPATEPQPKPNQRPRTGYPDPQQPEPDQKEPDDEPEPQSPDNEPDPQSPDNEPEPQSPENEPEPQSPDNESQPKKPQTPQKRPRPGYPSPQESKPEPENPEKEPESEEKPDSDEKPTPKKSENEPKPNEESSPKPDDEETSPESSTPDSDKEPSSSPSPNDENDVNEPDASSPKPKSATTPPSIGRPSTEKPDDSTSAKPRAEEPDSDDSQEDSDSVEAEPDTPEPEPGKECGVRRKVPRPNGPEGIETGFGEFPWHAQVLQSSNQSPLCSGAILSENIVVTAAHCLDNLDANSIVVKAGDWKLGSENPGEEPKPAQIRKVAAIAIHPEYQPGANFNDLAVIILSEPFTFDSHIDKLCLGPDAPPGQPPSGKNCVITGWGKAATRGNSPGSTMHSIPVSFMPNDKCQDAFKNSLLGKYFKLHNSFTCALPDSPNHDMCDVDVGSPISCQKPDGNYELAGIYSWDVGCHQKKNPSAVSKVDNKWVQDVMDTPVDDIKKETEDEKHRQEELGQAPEESQQSKPGFSQGYGK